MAGISVVRQRRYDDSACLFDFEYLRSLLLLISVPKDSIIIPYVLGMFSVLNTDIS